MKMKKQYKVPEVSVARMETSMMLCGSLRPGEGGSVDSDDNPFEGELQSLDRDVWKL